MSKGKWLYHDGMTTAEIYEVAIKQLEQHKLPRPSGDNIVRNAYRTKPVLTPKKEGNKILFSKDQAREIVTRIIRKAEKEKAKPADTQTPQTFKENLNNDAISSISHQVSIEEIKEPQYLKDLDELRQKLCEATDLIAKAFENLLGGF